MALSNQDYLDILRHLQSELRLAEPDLYEKLSLSLSVQQSPRDVLLRYLEAVERLVGQRSSGPYGRILDNLNSVVTTERGGPILGIRVLLTEGESALYEREVVDLETLPDRTNFIEELEILRRDIADEEEETEGEPA